MRHAGDPVAMRVVTFLGAASIVGLLSAATLSWTALRYADNDNAAVVIAIVGNLASAALASLGSILASTGKGSPQPVTVENTPTEPLPVVEATAPPVAATVTDDPYAVGPYQPAKES